MMKTLGSLLMMAFTFAPLALAQEHDRHEEHRERASHVEHMTEDAHAAAQVVHQLFDAMRAKDTTTMRALFHPSARLQRTGPNRQGELEVSHTPIDRFIDLIAGADGYLDEQIWDVEVRVDGDLATVWNKYVFYFNEQFSHCGMDAFQLARLADGWKIIQIADTQRRGEDNCWMPPEGERHGEHR